MDPVFNKIVCMNICYIDGCSTAVSRVGLCATHYIWKCRGVDPHSKIIHTRMYYATPAERLEAYVKRGQPNECWEWTRGCSKGYGNLSVGNGKYRPAHIVAWEIANNTALPKGMVIRHTCDNPPCCNPAHLLIGTPADNMADKVARGRQPRGESMATSKLTQQQVAEIRKRYAAGGIRQKDIAAEYGITQSNVSFLVRNITWAD